MGGAAPVWSTYPRWSWRPPPESIMGVYYLSLQFGFIGFSLKLPPCGAFYLAKNCCYGIVKKNFDENFDGPSLCPYHSFLSLLKAAFFYKGQGFS